MTKDWEKPVMPGDVIKLKEPIEEPPMDAGYAMEYEGLRSLGLARDEHANRSSGP